ncbi:hypothetical protein RFI_11578 [Reticulomyxa filosa]|uniref:Glycosyltransferase family 92 protein n=1 Tax=Reticulomyxa filosa TaxID=46433 RepID=X6NJM9_RETFI|nr:hypothetical protein RFI_11578 [Reticulomyxa filosa]|eukprot:ETO25562.1 hypothetical protein RFI_11578 [Reticulomyxa filosa]
MKTNKKSLKQQRLSKVKQTNKKCITIRKQDNSISNIGISDCKHANIGYNIDMEERHEHRQHKAPFNVRHGSKKDNFVDIKIHFFVEKKMISLDRPKKVIRKFPPALPESQRVEGVRNGEKFWEELAILNDLPEADPKGLIYVMNSIFLPKSKMLTIFTLTKEYLRPEHGLHAWPTRKIKRPQVYSDLPKTILEIENPTIAIQPPLFCVFFAYSFHNSSTPPNVYFVSKVDYVPNWTTRDRYVNLASSILRCQVPIEEMNGHIDFANGNARLAFALSQRVEGELLNRNDESTQKKDKLIHIRLSVSIGTRSAVGIRTRDRPFVYRNDSLFFESSPERQLTLCMPPISEPLPFLSENFAHHFNLGIEHIYIGTHFDHDKVEDYTNKLIERVKPWYDAGKVTIWPHEQKWLGFTDKAKDHWLNQCLYYVKDRDAYTLSLDADEFVLVHAFEKWYSEGHSQGDKPSLLSLLDSRRFTNEYCWLSFASYQVWKLWNPLSQLMIQRFTGREATSQYTWSKVIWNNDVLWYTGYQLVVLALLKITIGHKSLMIGGTHLVFITYPKYVYRFDEGVEARIWHYYNSRLIRIEPEDSKQRSPWSRLVNDTAMTHVYLPFIRAEFDRLLIPNSYPDNSFDVMQTPYYLKHYGDQQSMAKWNP